MQACNLSTQETEAGDKRVKVILSCVKDLKPTWAIWESVTKQNSKTKPWISSKKPAAQCSGWTASRWDWCAWGGGSTSKLLSLERHWNTVKCARHLVPTEWPDWIAWSTTIKVATGPEGTSWLRCTASKAKHRQETTCLILFKKKKRKKENHLSSCQSKAHKPKGCFNLKRNSTTMREEGTKHSVVRSPCSPGFSQHLRLAYVCLHADR